jgi:hypothetical protein
LANHARAPKQVLVDITYDAKMAKELYAIGLECIKKDPEAVIEYIIVKALKAWAKK